MNSGNLIGEIKTVDLSLEAYKILVGGTRESYNLATLIEALQKLNGLSNYSYGLWGYKK